MQSIFQRVLTPVAPIVLGKSPPRVFSAAVVHSVKTANRMPSNDQSNQLPIMKLRSCRKVDSNQIMEPWTCDLIISYSLSPLVSPRL